MTEQLTDRYCVSVNGHAVEPGCWVDGHWGQYGPDHLADRASELGWEPADPTDDPRFLRGLADRISERFPAEPFCKVCRKGVYWDDTPTEENPRLRTARCAEARRALHKPEPVWPSANVWEQRSDATDKIEQWLNDHTETEGYLWHWRDGEFYLSPICEDGDCDDDTCAHWD